MTGDDVATEGKGLRLMKHSISKTIGAAAAIAVTATVIGAAPASAATPAPTHLGNFISTGSVKDGSAVDMGTYVLFQAQTDGGTELWRTSGTAASTTPVKDIMPGVEGSLPRVMTKVGTSAFFTATGPEGRELWRSNGTEAGTVLVKDLVPGAGSSLPDDITALDATTAVFAADVDANGGRELWITNGTAAGTKLLKDINPAGDSSPHNLTKVGETVYFTADDGSHGSELWKTDGTADGTVMVEDIQPGASSSSPDELTANGGHLLFGAATANGRELWRSQGTAATTFQLRDINVGPASGAPKRMTVAGGTTLFAATSATGTEIWRTDGTALGTAQVKDIKPGPGSSNPNNLTTLGSTIVFSADDTGDNTELWISDGTSAGTHLLKDLVPGTSAGGNPQEMVSRNGKVFFRAGNGVNGTELWVTDGTLGHTAMVADLAAGAADSSPAQLGTLISSIVFRTFNGGSSQIWSIASTGLTVVDSATPKVSGSRTVGRTLTATAGTWEAGASLSYRWLRNGKPITGATGKTYVLKSVDHQQRISVRVSGAKDNEVTAVQDSSQSSPIAAGTMTRRPTPKITGKVKVGKTLKANPGKHDAGIKRTYQWLRNGKVINGSAAKKSSYKLTKSSKGKRIQVRVTVKKPGYKTVTKTSSKTSKVK